MLVVITTPAGDIQVVELAEPQVRGTYVVVRVSHSAVVLPDDLRTRPQDVPNAPRPLGFSASGTIMECGEHVSKLKTGLRVALAGAPYVYHATQLVVPENLVVELPKKVNHEEAAFAGPGAQALAMLRAASVQLGEVILIVGADLLGIIAAQVVRAAGATPILIDESEFRLQRAQALGINHAYTPDNQRFIDALESSTAAQGADAALLIRSSENLPSHLAVSAVREGGVLVLSDGAQGAIDLQDLQARNIRLRPAPGMGSGFGDRDFEIRGAGYPRSLARWTERDNLGCFCDLLAERKVQLSPLISDRTPLQRAPVIYEKSTRGRDAVLAAVLTC